MPSAPKACSLLAAAAALMLANGAAAKPARIMSLNQCADQLVLMLADPGRIASVTYLAAEGAGSPALAAKARALKANHGLAEEVLAEHPDLLIAGDVTTPLARQLSRRVGIPVIELKPATSFQDIRDQLRLVGQAVGEPERAEAWIERMDAALAGLDRTAPKRRITAVAWNGSGRVNGTGSLFDAILTAAGGYNLAADKGPFERDLDLEQLIALRPQPDVLLYGSSQRSRAGEHADQVRHPALTRLYGSRRLSYPEARYVCGTPFSADAAVELRQAMLAATAVPKAAR